MRERILVISPHGDDGELGCGGSICRFTEEKEEIHYIAFSDAKNVLPEGLDEDTLRREIYQATAILGVKSKNVYIYDFETRNFNKDRQKILDVLISIKKDIQPTLIFTPTKSDIHQDHQVINLEGKRAFKHISILGYNFPWNTFSFTPTYFTVLTREQLDKKILAVSQYVSQRGKLFLSKEAIESFASCTGLQIGVEYAESFEVVRWVV